MAKVMNTVFGIGIAFILFMVVMLGTQVFYKEPVYNCSSYYDNPVYSCDLSSCPGNMTVSQCNALVKIPIVNETAQKELEACSKKFEEKSQVYGKNLFIINNIAGIALVIASLFLFGMVNIAAGTAFAGLALIIYGFMRGWQGTGDVLKFIVALVVAGLFITFAVIVNKRYSKS